MKPCVFIHSNAKQRLGAEVARYALRRNSAAPDRFDIRLLYAEDMPVIRAQHGRLYLRQQRRVRWSADDLQSFTPLRFAVPEQMGYAGRALVMDPDIFALGDINELLAMDMRGAALLARPESARGANPAHHASSVMLLDCAQLRHWQLDTQFLELFDGRRDYRDWMWLLDEPAGSIGALPTVWNDFDRLEADTRMLHNTQRDTQPWKTGLPIDFAIPDKGLKRRAKRALRHAAYKLSGRDAPDGRYKAHPDPRQQQFFFGLVAECLERGEFGRDLVEREIALGHVRPDIFDCVAAATPAHSKAA